MATSLTSAGSAHGSTHGSAHDAASIAVPGTGQVRASRQALSQRLSNVKEFSHLTGRHLQGTITKADIAAVQRAADLPKSRRRLSAMVKNLAVDAMDKNPTPSLSARSKSAVIHRRSERDMSKGKSAVYSRDLLRAHAEVAIGAKTPGPSMLDGVPGFGKVAHPLFLDGGRRKSRSHVISSSMDSKPHPKSAAYAAPTDSKGVPPAKAAIAGSSNTAAARDTTAKGTEATGRREHPGPATRSDGIVVVKTKGAGGCCTVM